MDAAPIGLAEGVKIVLTRGAFWPVALWFFFNFAVFFSFGGLWGGPYLMHIFGFSKGQAGQVLSMLAIGMIIGSPLLSYLSNNILKARKPILVGSSMIMLVIVASLAFYTGRFSTAGLYLLCLSMGIFGNAVVVIGFTTTKELFPVQIAGTATGLINLFAGLSNTVYQERGGTFTTPADTASGQVSIRLEGGALEALNTLYVDDVSIPEPATLLLLAMGGIGLRRRK